MATTRAPRPTISSSRRAASGARLVRSSMPSAWAVDTSSKDTGAARSRASAASDWTAMPRYDRPGSVRSGLGDSPVGKPGPGRFQQLDDPFRGGAERRRQDDPQVVEGRGQRQDLEVRDRDDAPLVEHDDRVALRGVELDRELAVGVRERVAARRRGSAGGSGTTAGPAGSATRPLPDRAAVEQAAQVRERCREARIRSRHGDRGMEHRWVDRHALEAQRARTLHRVGQQPQCPRRQGPRHAVEKALLPRSARPSPASSGRSANRADAEVRHLGEVGLADRAERPHARRLIAVQRLDESIGERGRTPG